MNRRIEYCRKTSAQIKEYVCLVGVISPSALVFHQLFLPFNRLSTFSRNNLIGIIHYQLLQKLLLNDYSDYFYYVFVLVGNYHLIWILNPNIIRLNNIYQSVSRKILFVQIKTTY